MLGIAIGVIGIVVAIVGFLMYLKLSAENRLNLGDKVIISALVILTLALSFIDLFVPSSR